MKVGGLLHLGTWSQWELTAAQRAFLMGPDKHSGKGVKVNGKAASVRLTMEQMREMTRKSNEREKAAS
jgi:hypothetical protein